MVRAVFLDLSKAFDTVWIPGLLHKLQKYKIPSSIYDFIKSFLTNRKIIVDINGSLSQEYMLYGGTPQGSVISPLLFLIMINDFPTSDNPNIKKSLFADDSAVWILGSNYTHITNKLQAYLNEITRWCDLWGFQLNVAKTQTVTFTRRRLNEHIQLKIKNKNIEQTDTAKFLGIIFDNRLSWAQHIKYIQEKSKPRLNLLRSLTGSRFGSNKKTLLVIYKTLIRSVMDYACPVFISASNTQLKKLDSIQYSALTIICGALKGTSLLALQNECGELPLNLRREQILAKYICTVKMNPQNPTNEVLVEALYRGSIKQKPARHYLADYIEQLNVIREIQHPEHYSRESDNFVDIRAQNSESDNIQAWTETHQSQYINYEKIYTDASVNNKKVGAAFYDYSFNRTFGVRLPDYFDVFTAEATAIKLSLQYIQEQNFLNTVIYTDSLSVASSIRDSTQTPSISHHLRLELSRLARMGYNIKICWIPGHTGIVGNTKADEAAKLAAKKIHESEKIEVYPENYRTFVDHVILEKWQYIYDNSPKGKHFKKIQPNISLSLKYNDNYRPREIVVTRFRLGQINTNSRLHRIGRREDPGCPNCSDPETVEHLLFNCTGTHLLPSSIPIDKALDGGEYSKSIYNSLILLQRHEML